jgi:hypothetical protein
VKPGSEGSGIPEDRFNHALKALSYLLVGKFGIGSHYDQLGNRTLTYRPRFPTR